MDNATIEKLNIKDIKQAKELLKISAVENFKKNGLIDEEDIKNRLNEKIKIVDAYFDKSPVCTAMYGAKIDNKLVGLIAVGSQTPKVIKHIEDNFRDVLEIKSLFILPSYQKCGLGMKLFIFACNELLKNKHTNFMLYSSFKTGQEYWQKILGEPYKIVNENNVIRKIWLQKIKAQ